MVELRSPFFPDALKKPTESIQINAGKKIKPEDLAAMNAFIGRHAHLPLRVYDVGQGDVDLEFLSHFSNVRKLELDLSPDVKLPGLLTLSVLDTLPDSMVTLNIGVTKGTKKGLEKLTRFRDLEELGIGGKVKDLQKLVPQLKHLKRLSLWRHTLEDLRFLGDMHLQRLSLLKGSLGSLAGLESLPHLQELMLEELRGLQNGEALAHCVHLKKIELVFADFPIPPLPGLRGLHHLHLIRDDKDVELLRAGLSNILQAPALRTLSMSAFDGMSLREIKAGFEALLDQPAPTPPGSLQRVWFGNMADAPMRDRIGQWLGVKCVSSHWQLEECDAAAAEPAEPASNAIGPDDDHEGEYDRRIDAIEERVQAAIAVQGEATPCLVAYSAYGNDENDLPVDNLDHVAVHGMCRFRHTATHAEGSDYLSAIVNSPTWLDVALLANEMLRVTGDVDHYFFEGVCEQGSEDGVAMYAFQMGS